VPFRSRSWTNAGCADSSGSGIMGLSVKDQTDSYFLLNSPIIRKIEDHYGPVRFMHSKHAVVIKDCALCHHYRPLNNAASETTRCSACHQEPFNRIIRNGWASRPPIISSAWAAIEEMNKGPVDCAGCHRKNVPDHKEHSTAGQSGTFSGDQ
jgi:hypothetical protein